jgi:hypothetical protein
MILLLLLINVGLIAVLVSMAKLTINPKLYCFGGTSGFLGLNEILLGWFLSEVPDIP